MRQPATAVALLFLFACTPEDLAGVQPHQAGLHELSHVVTVRFEENAAQLRVVREVRNDGDSVAMVFAHEVRVPDGAVATALRLGRNGELPAAGVLSTADDVAERWSFLTGPGEAAPTPIGKLDWLTDGALSLDLFGLLPGETVTVAYDLLVPPRYEGGALVFDFPREDLAEGWLPPRFERADAEETVDGYVVRRQHQTQPVADIRWGTSQLDTDRTLWRLEIDAALQLEPAPVAPNVVFVIDASHSQGPEGIAAQLELITPYLLDAPDARVEIVLTRRFAERLFGRFVPAADVPGLLKMTPTERLAPGNGSNLDVGAGLAAQALAEVGGPARVVLFTDEALRFEFSNALAITALAAAPRDTIAHVVDRSSLSRGALTERRDDGAALSPIAAATGGIFLRVRGGVHDVEEAAKTLLGLVRPIRVDDFKVEGTGVEGLAVDEQLVESSMVRLQGIDAAPAERITFTGKIWAREFRREVAVDGALAKRLPAIAVGDGDLRSQLSDDELRSAAFLAQAVSPVTSFFCAPATAAPSSAGSLEGGGFGRLGLKGFGCGGCSSTSRCGFGIGRGRVDHLELLRGLLAPGVAACELQHGEAAAGRASIEATGDEVVAVQVSGASTAMNGCLTEAAWAIRLGDEFTAHRSYEVDLTTHR